MESVLGRLHCFQRVIREQSLLSRPRYAPTLNSGEARRAALVARFAASPSAAAASPTSRRPVPPSASLAAPRNRAEREALAGRYYPGAFCDNLKEQGSGDGFRLWHLHVVALTCSRDTQKKCCCNRLTVLSWFSDFGL